MSGLPAFKKVVLRNSFWGGGRERTANQSQPLSAPGLGHHSLPHLLGGDTTAFGAVVLAKSVKLFQLLK